MNRPSHLRQVLGLLLISCGIGTGNAALAKEKKAKPAIQCEQNGALTPCPADQAIEKETPTKATTFKAQADPSDTPAEKKHPRKKKSSKKPSNHKKPKADHSGDA